MNSKERLYEILGMLNYEQVDECDKKGLLRIIKQDLELLEIFKDNVMIDEDEKVVTLFSKNKEVVNKIKEWLYE